MKTDLQLGREIRSGRFDPRWGGPRQATRVTEVGVRLRKEADGEMAKSAKFDLVKNASKDMSIDF